MAQGQSVLSSLVAVIVIFDGEIPGVCRTSRVGKKLAMNVMVACVWGCNILNKGVQGLLPWEKI